MKFLANLIILIVFLADKSNQFSFARYYQDKMVLQRSPYRSVIWGYGSLESNVFLTLFGKNYTSQVRKLENYDNSVWKIQLDPIDYKQSVDLEFTELNSDGSQIKIYLKDVLFGDVWLCGGQSNMQLSLTATIEGKQEIENGYKYKDKIRLFTVETFSSDKPEYDLLKIKQNWSVPSNESLGSFEWQYFSAVCWHFGKKLTEKIDHPIGLLVSCWGGTEVERWSNEEVLNSCGVKNRNKNDSSLWNSMIHPLLNFPIYGAIWYQGESNTNYNRDLYSCNFEGMVKSWRKEWYEKSNKSTNPNFPFGIVQLANWHVNKTDYYWPWLRWHQTADFGYCPNEKLNNVFMTTAVDLVDNSDDPIHPRYKEDIGIRLGLGAFYFAYDIKEVEYAPPKVNSVKYDRKLEIKFESEFKPIEFKIVNKNGFDLCCDTSECLSDDYNNWYEVKTFDVVNETVLMDKPDKCKDLKYVRYLWNQKPCEFKSCSLYAKRSNLPLYPFISKIDVVSNYAFKNNLSFSLYLFNVLTIFNKYIF